MKIKMLNVANFLANDNLQSFVALEFESVANLACRHAAIKFARF